jgi:hypothetical protein
LLDGIFHLVLLAGAVGTLGLMAYAGSPGESGWWPWALTVGAWLLLPYVAASRLARRLWVSSGAGWVLVLSSIAIVGATFAVLRHAFFVAPDAQSAIVLLFVPVWQAVLWALAITIARWARLRRGVGN